MKPKFKLRGTQTKDGLRQIYLVYTHKGIALRLPMAFKIPEECWDDKRQRVLPSVSKIKLVQSECNDELDRCENRLRKVIEEYRRDNDTTEDPETDYVRKRFYSNEPAKTGEADLITLYEKFVNEKKALGKKNLARIETVKKELESFLGERKGKAYLKDIDREFLIGFWAHLIGRKVEKRVKGGRALKGLSYPVAKKKLAILKQFLKDLEMKGKRVKSDYRFYKPEAVIQKEDPVILSREEFSALESLDLSFKPSLERVRDKFLVSSYTGLRFNELFNISDACRNSLKTEKGDLKTLHVYTSKTKTYVDPPLTPKCEAILDKYSWKLEKVSNQKANDYLRKILGMLAESNPSLKEAKPMRRKSAWEEIPQEKTKIERMHWHSSRAYFICDCLRKRVPVNIIMGFTGHQGDFEVFSRYLDRTEGREEWIGLLSE